MLVSWKAWAMPVGRKQPKSPGLCAFPGAAECGVGAVSWHSLILKAPFFRFMKEDQCQTIRFGGSHIGRQTRVLLLVIITWRCVWAEIDVRWCAENFHKKLLPFLAEQPEARHLVLSVLESVRTPTDCRRHCGEKAFLCHVVAFRGIPDFFGKAA